MRVLVINSAEKGITQFTDPLKEIVESTGCHCAVIQYKEMLATDTGNYDRVIISGSPRGNDIVDNHLPYFQWIKTSDIPIFGICAGHHITGALYGSQLLRSIEKEVGHFEVFIDVHDPIFNGFSHSFTAHQNHHDSITLPPGFILLAHTRQCKVSMMKHPGRPLYTCQFHPETLNPKLLVNFINVS